MSRKDRIAPFEVMRLGREQRERQQADDAKNQQFDTLKSDDATLPVFESGHSGPFLLRIPKGYAVLAAMVLLGLLTMAYWVGYSRGDKDRHAKMIELKASRQEMYSRTAGLKASLNEGSSIVTQPESGTGFNGSFDASSSSVYSSKNYVPGFNYFVLVHYPHKEAGELVEFLKGHGVVATAILVNNNRFKVVALEGFLASELDRVRVREYKQLLRRLGRLWQGSQRGAGDLSDMYPERYDGPPPEAPEGKTH
ncbi:MAG: hypothetical protein JKX85_04350 [Phycisphaeraceae bacterium]|nr:hypothetical protein [Phycisphaeraceae bacterium]